MSAHRRTETQVKQYIRQFHSVHLADIMNNVKSIRTRYATLEEK